jgi:esterase/lipase superfamily enzyme
MDITLAVGEQGQFHERNRVLSYALAAKSVPHRLPIWPGRSPSCPMQARDGASLPVVLAPGR